MKIPIILLIFVMFFGTFFIVNSNALIGPPAPMEDPSIPELTLQMIVRNSDGVLVTYIEPTNFYLSNIYLTHQNLDKKENKNIIVKDGISYEQFNFGHTYYDSSDGQRASYSIWEEGFSVVTSRFNGFLSEPGDTQTTMWSITRTIP